MFLSCLAESGICQRRSSVAETPAELTASKTVNFEFTSPILKLLP